MERIIKRYPEKVHHDRIEVDPGPPEKDPNQIDIEDLISKSQPRPEPKDKGGKKRR